MKVAIILAVLCAIATTTTLANEVETIPGTNLQLTRLGSGRTRSGKSYYLSPPAQGFTWEQARFHCQQSQLNMLMIKSESEQTEIQNMLLNESPLPDNIWMGGYCNPVTNTWFWIDRTPVSIVTNHLPSKNVACAPSSGNLMLFGPRTSYPDQFTWKGENALNQFICQS